MATAEFSRFAGILTALVVGKKTLSQNDRKMIRRLVDEYNKRKCRAVLPDGLHFRDNGGF